jgi:hypothetical protein
MKILYFTFLMLVFIGCQSSTKTAENSTTEADEPPTTAKQLLTQSIKFHDPDGKWDKFAGTLTLQGERPDGTTKTTQVLLNNPLGLFVMTRMQDSLTLEQGVKKDSCFAKINASGEVSDSLQKKYRLDCGRTKLMRDYYGYLYGLPMKLKDKGTQIEDKIKRVKFQGKEYLSIKVTYEAKVGKDTWYFYFNPATYALEGYRFYHDASKNEGEYITLEGLETVQGIKIPKTRAWYVNKDDKFLGKDILLPEK